MFKNLTLFVLLLFSSLNVLAGKSILGWNWITSDNSSPKQGMKGFTFGALLPMGESGQVFIEPMAPHAEYGLFTGFDYWKRFQHYYDYHIGLQTKYQQYHFHYELYDEELDGYYRFWHLTAPISMNFPIKNYPYLFFKLGAAISTTNLLFKSGGKIGPFDYFTRIYTGWTFYPEIQLGLDFMEEKNSKVWVRAGIDFSFIPIKSMGQTETYLLNGPAQGVRAHFNPSKFQVRLDFYPVWKRRRRVSDSNKCPNPF